MNQSAASDVVTLNLNTNLNRLFFVLAMHFDLHALNSRPNKVTTDIFYYEPMLIKGNKMVLRPFTTLEECEKRLEVLIQDNQIDGLTHGISRDEFRIVRRGLLHLGVDVVDDNGRKKEGLATIFYNATEIEKIYAELDSRQPNGHCSESVMAKASQKLSFVLNMISLMTQDEVQELIRILNDNTPDTQEKAS